MNKSTRPANLLLLTALALAAPVVSKAQTPATRAESLNTLSDSEKTAGWRLLWDGKTLEGWRSVKSADFPETGWSITNGTLSAHHASDTKSARGGDITTREQFSDFELVVDFQITPIANSGIKYFVQPKARTDTALNAKPAAISSVGCEFQILDDERHPDAKLGRDGNRTLGSLYDLIPASAGKNPNPIGEWNTAKVIAKGGHVEHWLNGLKVVSYDRDTTEFRASVAQSKFKDISNFGEWPRGHILLQDHGDTVSFRNIKIRILPTK